MAMKCRKCLKVHQFDVKDWGREPATHGLGPEPVCPQLIVDPRFPNDPLHPLCICGGALETQAA